MIIYKVTNIKDNKLYIGYSHNDNSNNLGTGKYIKRAVRDFGIDAFEREVIKKYEDDISLEKAIIGAYRFRR